MQVNKPEDRGYEVDPRMYPDYTEADVQSVRALAAGRATPDQQKNAIDFLVNFVCCTNDVPYRDSNRHTLLALGKQIVGRHIIWLLKIAPVKTDPAQRDAHYEGER